MSRFAIVCALSLVTLPAMAQQKGLSYGVMLGSSNYSQTGYSFDMPTITGRVIYNHNSWLGAEARLGYGDSATSNGVDMGIDWLAGGYLKASIETIDRLYVTAYGGYTSLDTTATPGSTVNKGSASGGVSLDFYADQSSGLNVEWMRYFDGTLRGANTTIDHIGIGYFQKF
jgi:hypothetical protein